MAGNRCGVNGRRHSVFLQLFLPYIFISLNCIVTFEPGMQLPQLQALVALLCLAGKAQGFCVAGDTSAAEMPSQIFDESC